MTSLSVNVDHVATVREARGVSYPDPVHAAILAEIGGAEGITVHLRGDQRHIKVRDVRIIRDVIQTRLTLEMEPSEEMIAFAAGIKPHMVTLVPERPGEVTTEGGFDFVTHGETVSLAIAALRDSDILLCGFVDPDVDQIQAAAQIGLDAVELCTNRYSECGDMDSRLEEVETLKAAARLAVRRGLRAHAGHGITYDTVGLIASIPEISELSIGHCIVGRAILVGMERAVGEMREAIRRARFEHSRDNRIP